MTMPTSGPSSTIIETVGDLLADSLRKSGRSDEDTGEIEAITQAMIRLLIGVPLRSDGKLTIKTLAQEAGLRRNKLTHKHTGLKDLFKALVKTHDSKPAVTVDLHNDNANLRNTISELRQANSELSDKVKQFARIVHVLEVENQQLREQLTRPDAHDNVRLLRQTSRHSDQPA